LTERNHRVWGVEDPTLKWGHQHTTATGYYKTQYWNWCDQLTFAARCVCSNACGVTRPGCEKVLVTSACTWSKLSTLAATVITAELLFGGFSALAGRSGMAAFTGWNVFARPSTGLICWPVSTGAGGAMFSVRRRTVFGLSGWSSRLTDENVCRNRGLSCNLPPALAPSLCRIWLRSISSNVEAFWLPATSWIPVTAGLIQPQHWNYFNVHHKSVNITGNSS